MENGRHREDPGGKLDEMRAPLFFHVALHCALVWFVGLVFSSGLLVCSLELVNENSLF